MLALGTPTPSSQLSSSQLSSSRSAPERATIDAIEEWYSMVLANNVPYVVFKILNSDLDD
jgi:hypothetical protein